MKQFIYFLLLFLSMTVLAQSYDYASSEQYPFGRINPKAPKELSDYESMIGTCECKSISRINQTTWGDTVLMTWTFKYIMNGMGIQDQTLKSDGVHSGSIRQFNADSSKWYVHYYTSSAAVNTLPSWSGDRKEDNKIVLYREQSAPNGMEGFYKITFYDMSDAGYNWLGEWVNKSETISYPTWKIFCDRND